MLISLEGNIGSGKSTLLEDIKQCKFIKHCIVIPEDVTGWTSFSDSKGKNILEYFYASKQAFGFTFQMLVVVSRIRQILDEIRKHPDAIIITERSHWTDLMIFVQTLFENNEITEIEYLTYKQCHEHLNSLLNVRVDGIIYNKTSPHICMQRICKRSRKGEDLIPSHYINDLHVKHDNWLMFRQDENSPKVFLVDGDIDESETESRVQQLESVVTFVNELYVTSQTSKKK
jgi:deoxyadenosine/deoxycytidine kinase